MSILLGSGDGTFQRALDVAVGSYPEGFITGDFDGDGHPDLAVVNSASNMVSILLGTGDGTFERTQDVGVGFNPGF